MFERPSRNVAKHPPEDTAHLLKSITWTATCQTVHPFKRRQASTTGIQDLDVEERAPLRNKSQASGISSHCRKRLNTFTTRSSRFVSTLPTTEDARCSSIRTLSSLMLRSNPCIFTISGAYCQMRWLKETQAVFSKEYYHDPLFRRQPPSGQQTFTVMSLHINNNDAKRGIGKKLLLTVRAVMLDEKVDLVAGDFKGAVWRRSTSNNISIIEEAFADCALPMPPGHTPLWGPGSILGSWADVCGFLKPPESDRQWASWCFFHSSCKGNIPCTSYSRTFTIHNYGYGTAYTYTHNNITLEHTVMNNKNTITHTDAYNTQY